MDKLEALKQKLRDFKPIQSLPNKPTTNIITRIIDPPSYIVQYVLLAVCSLNHYGMSDKVWWQTYFAFKNRIFKVRDYKFGSWTIEGNDTTEEGKKIAIEVKEKITKACKELDKLLYPELKERVEKGDYHINNAYRKLVDIFEFHLEKTHEAIRDYDDAVKELEGMKPPPEMKLPKKSKKKGVIVVQDRRFENYLNRRYRLLTEPVKAITNYCFAMMTSFYSLTEFLMEAIYAFEQSKMPLDDFQKSKWNEKFKLLFPIHTNEELNRFYNTFIDIKRNYRNPLTHGLADEAGRLVWLPYAGLVPISYYLSTKVNYNDVRMTKEDALSIIKTFTKFLDYIQNNDPYRFYIHYLTYGFPIHMNPKQIAQHKAKMTSFEEFQKYMEIQAMQHDAYVNREEYPW